MKTKTFILLGLMASMASVQAANINIPDASFENVTATVNPPVLIGTTTGNIGAWTATMSGLLSLGGSMKSDTSASLSGPAPANGTYEVKLNLPASVLASASLSQT